MQEAAWEKNKEPEHLGKKSEAGAGAEAAKQLSISPALIISKITFFILNFSGNPSFCSDSKVSFQATNSAD